MGEECNSNNSLDLNKEYQAKKNMDFIVALIIISSVTYVFLCIFLSIMDYVHDFGILQLSLKYHL